jgi:hypothetical protein
LASAERGGREPRLPGTPLWLWVNGPPEPGNEIVDYFFVRSPNSDGWVYEFDLPSDKQDELDDRFAVEQALYAAALETPGSEASVIARFVKRFPDRALEIEATVRQEQARRRREHVDYWAVGIVESALVHGQWIAR